MRPRVRAGERRGGRDTGSSETRSDGGVTSLAEGFDFALAKKLSLYAAPARTIMPQ